MSQEQFEDLLSRVGPLIQRKNTRPRSLYAIISLVEPLAVTPHFLATGKRSLG
jgi:hypothetical protein